MKVSIVIAVSSLLLLGDFCALVSAQLGLATVLPGENATATAPPAVVSVTASNETTDTDITAIALDDNTTATTTEVTDVASSNSTEEGAFAVTTIETVDSNTNATETTVNETFYDGCDVNDYYADLLATSTDATTWSMDALMQLVTDTHRMQLPNVGSKGEENVLKALIDLDAGYDTDTFDDTVRLYDRNIDFEAAKQNTPEGWKRGDLWPLVRMGRPDVASALATMAGTDVHSKRPADWEVDSELESLFWGVCGTVEDASVCQTPAVANQTDDTTSTDYKIKTPSVEVRGEVARAVLYNVIRYGSELGLNITDCPPFSATDYGYKSELLKWHLESPTPSDREVERNSRACSRWQGNRNPLIDYPNLVTALFGQPDDIVVDSFQYAACAAAGIETDSPTATPNECSGLEPGDVSILIFNSDPVDQIVLFPVVDLPPSIGSLYVTDRAWNGTDFCPNEEGTIEYVLPPEGRKAGKVFGYKVQFPDDSGNWTEVPEGEAGNGIFDLSTLTGDNMFVYCLNADDEPHFLSALVYNDAGFAPSATGTSPTPAVATTTDNETAAVASQLAVAGTCDVSTTILPSTLQKGGVLALPFSPNYLYNGIREGDRVELLAAFADPANYKGNDVPYNILTSGAAAGTVGTACMLALSFVLAWAVL